MSFLYLTSNCNIILFKDIQEVICIRALEDKILSEGLVLPGEILKVGSFLNQQIDTTLLMDMGSEIARLYKDSGITKVLTIESSGIAVAFAAGFKLGVPVVFAKKHASINLSDDVITSEVYSYTHQKTYTVVIGSEYLGPDDTVLIVDDFLAKGNAIKGLIEITNKAGAKLAGAAIAIEKGFQGGGDALRAQGIRVESLAIVDSMSDDSLTFRRQDQQAF